ncbi:MAG: hypothetical protein CMC81_07035 [Flavobacteriaceae bacterium]|nr:hypothetical protein [Flavobacteriaceae bacterium]
MDKLIYFILIFVGNLSFSQQCDLSGKWVLQSCFIEYPNKTMPCMGETGDVSLESYHFNCKGEVEYETEFFKGIKTYYLTSDSTGDIVCIENYWDGQLVGEECFYFEISFMELTLIKRNKIPISVQTRKFEQSTLFN